MKCIFEINEKCKNIIDLIILENSDSEIKFLILDNENDIVSMKIVQYPEFSTCFEIKNIEKSWLVNTKLAINMYYVSGNKSSSEFVDNISMYKLSELDPAERFKKIIRKGNLEEAEEFAKQFNLSTQPILEEKIKIKLNDLKTEIVRINNLILIKINYKLYFF